MSELSKVDPATLKKAGKGGFGIVYYAEKANKPKRVAIKFIFKRDDMLEWDIVREVAMLRDLQHNNHSTSKHWIQFIEADAYKTNALNIAGDPKWYIMSRYAGKSTLAKIRKPLSKDELQAIAFQLLWITIQTYKEHRIIHNDLKLENVIIRPRTSKDPTVYGIQDDRFFLQGTAPMIVYLDTGGIWKECNTLSVSTIPSTTSTAAFSPWNRNTDFIDYSVQFDLFSIGLILISLGCAFKLKDYNFKLGFPPFTHNVDNISLQLLLLMRDIGLLFDEKQIPDERLRLEWNLVEGRTQNEDILNVLTDSFGVNGVRLIRQLMSFRAEDRVFEQKLDSFFLHRYFSNLYYGKQKNVMPNLRSKGYVNSYEGSCDPYSTAIEKMYAKTLGIEHMSESWARTMLFDIVGRAIVRKKHTSEFIKVFVVGLMNVLIKAGDTALFPSIIENVTVIAEISITYIVRDPTDGSELAPEKPESLYAFLIKAIVQAMYPLQQKTLDLYNKMPNTMQDWKEIKNYLLL